MVIGVVCAIIGAFEIGESWGGMGLGSRMFFMPNMLSWCYYDFFQQHLPIIYGLLGYETVNRAAIPTIIGGEYMGSSEMYANSGLFGDAMMLLGLPGVILGPVLWQLYFCIMDRLTPTMNYTIKMGIGFFGRL